jgi:hypothetical protein
MIGAQWALVHWGLRLPSYQLPVVDYYPVSIYSCLSQLKNVFLRQFLVVIEWA